MIRSSSSLLHVACGQMLEERVQWRVWLHWGGRRRRRRFQVEANLLCEKILGQRLQKQLEVDQKGQAIKIRRHDGLIAATAAHLQVSNQIYRLRLLMLVLIDESSWCWMLLLLMVLMLLVHVVMGELVIELLKVSSSTLRVRRLICQLLALGLLRLGLLVFYFDRLRRLIDELRSILLLLS